jgi:hypothetical protein
MKLIKKNIIFVFNENYKKAFKELKIRLTSTLILSYYNLERKTILKLDTLNSITIEIFSQLDLINK